MIVWYILIAIFCMFLSMEYFAYRTKVPTVATFPTARRKVIEALRKYNPLLSEKSSGLIIDLGSGNGQMGIKVARAFPNATVIGLEISIVPWIISWLRQKAFGPQNLTFRRTNFWDYDCSKADAVIVYLTPHVLDRASAKLRQELKSGTIIAVNDDRLRGDWQPIEIIDTGFFNMKVSVYRQA